MRITFLVFLGAFAAIGCGAGEGTRAPDAPRAQAVPAPPLVGTLADGGAFRLDELRGDPVVLVFYRGSFCALCRQRLRALDEHIGAYRRLGARVVAVTLDDAETAKATADELDLDLPLISVDRATFDAWGLWPADEAWPRPAAFVLDASGAVRFGHVGLNAADRVEDVVLLAVLGRLDDDAPVTRTGR